MKIEKCKMKKQEFIESIFKNEFKEHFHMLKTSKN
jgi:hypothetical protein